MLNDVCCCCCCRPYYQERKRITQHLAQLKASMKVLEQKLSDTKKRYADSLQHLELLSTEIHMRRKRELPVHRDTLEAISTVNLPELRSRHAGEDSNDSSSLAVPGIVNATSLDSLQMSDMGDQFSGSVGSLHSSDHEHNDLLPDDDHHELHLKHLSLSSRSSSPSISPSPLSSSSPVPTMPSSTAPRVPTITIIPSSTTDLVTMVHPTSARTTIGRSIADTTFSGLKHGTPSSCSEPSHLESVASDLVVQCVSAAVSQVDGMSDAHVARVASDLVVQCVDAAVSQVHLTSDANVARVANDLVVQCVSAAVTSDTNVARVASDLVVQCVSAAVSQMDLTFDADVASNAQDTHHSSKASS